MSRLRWLWLPMIACLLPPAALAADPRSVRTIGVVDFRAENESAVFRARFERLVTQALARSGLAAKVAYELATLPRDSFAPEIRRIEGRSPDIYYATTTDIAREIRAINPRVPIVFSGIVDPKAAGLVESIERPGGNMTGFVVYEDLADKRLEILASLNPRIRRIGIVVQHNSNAHEQMPRRIAFGRRTGLEIVPLVFDKDESSAALPGLIARHRLDALDAPTSVFLRRRHRQVIDAANAAGIPCAFDSADFVERGGLLSYQPQVFDWEERAVSLIEKVLKGTPAGDIPIEFPSEFVLAINVTAATRLPMALNKHVLKRANKLVD